MNGVSAPFSVNVNRAASKTSLFVSLVSGNVKLNCLYIGLVFQICFFFGRQVHGQFGTATHFLVNKPAMFELKKASWLGESDCKLKTTGGFNTGCKVPRSCDMSDFFACNPPQNNPVQKRRFRLLRDSSLIYQFATIKWLDLADQ